MTTKINKHEQKLLYDMGLVFIQEHSVIAFVSRMKLAFTDYDVDWEKLRVDLNMIDNLRFQR